MRSVFAHDDRFRVRARALAHQLVRRHRKEKFFGPRTGSNYLGASSTFNQKIILLLIPCDLILLDDVPIPQKTWLFCDKHLK